MKTIGVIGGMSWESSATYYKWLNEGVRDQLGGLHSARILMTSVDFEEIERYQANGNWDKAGEILAQEARNLERGGADFIILATNTMHKVADAIVAAVEIPFIHLADATAGAINEAGIDKVGLMATLYTMEQDFYKGRLIKQGIDVIVPSSDDRQRVHAIIYDELCQGRKEGASRAFYLETAKGMIAQGAQGIVLGCTEINLLIGEGDFDVPVFDTTRIHIQKALKLALS